MSDSVFRHSADSDPLPELAEKLVLWRLRSYDDEWWCTVERLADRLCLRVHTPDRARTALTEVLETASSVVGRSDALLARYLAQGWERDDADFGSACDSALPILTVWFSAPDWQVTNVESQAAIDAIPREAIMGEAPIARMLAPETVELVLGALDVARNGQPQTVYFKAIRDSGVRWRRGLIHREEQLMRMDIYQATEEEAVTDAIEVDLRM